jgi:homoserine O-acetyltransferase
MPQSSGHPGSLTCHPERSEGSAAVTELPAFEVVGPRDAPAVVVLGGISANRHVRSTGDDPSPGWWESVAALTTKHYSLVGVDFIDGGERPDGRPERIVTIADQADAVAAVLDHLGIPRLHALVGASFGGMVSLALAERYPERVERLVVIGAAHRTHPMTIAVKVIQRRIVEMGLDTNRAREAMVLARALAITTFRSAPEFDKRFNGPPEEDYGAVSFPVESYLFHHGEKLARRFTPARFLALSLAGDLHSVDPSRITACTTLVAIEGDRNVPPELVAELAGRVAGPCTLLTLPSEIGHDAFLKDTEAVGRILRAALEASV